MYSHIDISLYTGLTQIYGLPVSHNSWKNVVSRAQNAQDALIQIIQNHSVVAQQSRLDYTPVNGQSFMRPSLRRTPKNTNRMRGRRDAVRRSERGGSVVRCPCVDDVPEFGVCRGVCDGGAVVKEVLQSAGEPWSPDTVRSWFVVYRLLSVIARVDDGDDPV